jgi:glycosyltransferase involved in cell wall biosynthesis
LKQIAILHFTAPPVTGGIESIIYHHLRLLNQAGYEILIIAGHGDEAYYETSFFHRIDYQAVPEIDPGNKDVIAAMTALDQDPGQFNSLRDRIANRLETLLEDVDICIVHDAMTASENMPLLAAIHQVNQKDHTTFIAWCHHPCAEVKSATETRYPYNLLHTVWDRVRYVAGSQACRQRLSQSLGIPKDSIQLIPTGIEPVVLQKWDRSTRRVMETLEITESEPLLLAPGDISPVSRLEYAFEIGNALRKYFPNARLLVAGNLKLDNPDDQAYLQRLKKVGQEMDLGESVYFLYEMGENEQPMVITEGILADFYQIADILLLTGPVESPGQPLLSAGLARLPIFAPELPSFQEITRGNGHFYREDEQPAAIAEAIARTLEASQEYSLRRLVMGTYTWNQIFEEKILPLIEG